MPLHNEATMRKTNIRIAQINANGNAAVVHEIRKVAEELKLDIVCVQEPYTKNGAMPGMPIDVRITMTGEIPKAATIIFNKNLTITNLVKYTDTHCVCIEVISKYGGIIIINQYYQFSEEIEMHLEKTRDILSAYSDKPVIVMADINAKSTLWHSGRTDERGREMEGLINEMQLDVINKPYQAPTYQNRAGAATNIDVTLANSRVAEIEDWRVEEHATCSDHNLIHMTLLGHPTNVVIDGSLIKYNLRKANWETLKHEIRIQPPIRNSDANNMAKELVRKIQKAVDVSIPKIRNTKIHINNKPWSEELTNLRRRVRVLRRVYQRTVDPHLKQQNLNAYRQKKVEYTNKIFETKINCWGKFVEDCLGVDIWGMPYKIVTQKIRSPMLFSTLQRTDGSATRNWKESAELLLKTLLPQDTLENETIRQTRLRETMVNNYTNEVEMEDLEEEEVRNAILALKKKKAPGPDSIKAEILQAIVSEITPDLTKVYNKCLRSGKFPNIWKQAEVVIIYKGDDKDPSLPKSYRPICLLNILGKVLERLICKKLTAHRENRGQLGPNQYGFRKGRSTEDAINRALWEVGDSECRYVLMISIDIAGAFDNLWWPGLFKELRKMECPHLLYKILRSYCQDRYATLRCPNEKIVTKLTKGCPQGSICGPIFWDIVMDKLLRKTSNDGNIKSAIAYADDLLVIVEGDSRAEIERKSNEALGNINGWCGAHKMEIAAHKSTMSLMKGSLMRNPTIRLGGRSIQRKVSNKYLGIRLDERQLYSEHLQEVCEKGGNLMHKIARLATKEYKIPLPLIRTYINTIMTSVIGYGASIWAHRLLRIKPREKVRRTQRGVLIRFSGAFGTVSLEALLVSLGITPIDLEIRRRAALYWLRKQQIEKVHQILQRPAANKREIENVIAELWQEEWTNTTKGARIKEFFPIIANRNNMAHMIPSQGMIHFLTGHGPYPTHIFRMGKMDRPECECGVLGTPEHVLLECANTTQQIMELREQLGQATIQEVLADGNKFTILNKIADLVSKKALEDYRQQRR